MLLATSVFFSCVMAGYLATTRFASFSDANLTANPPVTFELVQFAVATFSNHSRSVWRRKLLFLRVESKRKSRSPLLHYPAARREWRFFNGALDISPTIVVIDGSGDVTMEAIDWLARHHVPLMRIRWDGQFSSIVIRRKAENTLITLDEHLPRSPLSDRACKNIALRAELLKRKTARTFSHLLGIEGSIAGDYFRVWSEIPLKWKPLKKYPIPKDWSVYRSRVALRHGIRLRNDGGGYNRGATHPVNAMLNYAYAVLIAQTQIRLIVEGYDPTIGIMHEKKALRGINPGFALDHMEPMRLVVDRLQALAGQHVLFEGLGAVELVQFAHDSQDALNRVIYSLLKPRVVIVIVVRGSIEPRQRERL